MAITSSFPQTAVSDDTASASGGGRFSSGDPAGPATPLDRSESDSGCRALREQAGREGVVCTDNLPFLLGPADAEAGVLMVHGFAASPWEMRLIGEYLAGRGLSVLAVRLPGHGSSTEDLARRRWEEWLTAVETGYRLLADQHAQVYGIGMSTGCLLLLRHALDRDYQGLALCAPYLRIRHRLATFAGWLRWVLPFHGKELADGGSPHYYSRRPVAGVYQINRLIKSLRPRLAACRAPVLAFNSEGDRTVISASGRQLLASLGSTTRIHLVYGDEVPHILVREQNPHHRALFRLIENFIAELTALTAGRRTDGDRVRRPPDGSVPSSRSCR
ncbi:MAG: alpha/beta fold hydrolase [Desulfuromonadales bacterium]|nr:alpha/beta fold hydrolase [Desulfuromonadales bacterium]